MQAKEKAKETKSPKRGPVGRLVVTLVDERGEPAEGEGLVLALEHAPAFARQFRAEGDAHTPFELEVPAGEYSIQAAAGKASGRTGACVEAKQTTEVRVALDEPAPEPRTMADRLRPYGLEHRVDPRPLEVPCESTVVLDSRRYYDKRDFAVLMPESVDDLKRWIGTPDAAIGHDLPRFGTVPELNMKGKEELGQSEQEALGKIAREYIFGNSKLVAEHKGLIDRELLKWTARDIAIFFFTVVTIDAGATLEVGNNSNVFTCDELRIHRNGTLSIVGDVKVDVGTYRVFG
ncbi:MAG: hypothetical protein M3Y75_14085 [Actinomycetota bacterium]|nr:hypothetical protein [Actinomycetota bacterium]